MAPNWKRFLAFGLVVGAALVFVGACGESGGEEESASPVDPEPDDATILVAVAGSLAGCALTPLIVFDDQGNQYVGPSLGYWEIALSPAADQVATIIDPACSGQDSFSLLVMSVPKFETVVSIELLELGTLDWEPSGSHLAVLGRNVTVLDSSTWEVESNFVRRQANYMRTKVAWPENGPYRVVVLEGDMLVGIPREPGIAVSTWPLECRGAFGGELWIESATGELQAYYSCDGGPSENPYMAFGSLSFADSSFEYGELAVPRPFPFGISRAGVQALESNYSGAFLVGPPEPTSGRRATYVEIRYSDSVNLSEFRAEQGGASAEPPDVVAVLVVESPLGVLKFIELPVEASANRVPSVIDVVMGYQLSQ